MLKGKANGANYQVQLYTDHDWKIFNTTYIPKVQIEAFGKSAVLTIACDVNIPATKPGVSHTILNLEQLGPWAPTGQISTVQDDVFVRFEPTAGLQVKSYRGSGATADATGYRYVVIPYIRVG